MDWPFDQKRNVAAVTTRQVMGKQRPVLSVVHYSDDHSWAFTCGTTSDPEDLMLVSMGEIIDLDETLCSIANLPPGWCADRSSVDEEWQKYQDDDI